MKKGGRSLPWVPVAPRFTKARFHPGKRFNFVCSEELGRVNELAVQKVAMG